ncbi:hypothetical protein AU15_10150 [Marinobacter salarius]|uniref:Uncharacterized protein n=1 Tax=Marinobacter salarius TaxID=1420917 RepID=W5YVQ9_9GAMM|nr:hypothetical protein AU15_10150 [Marinobacter salarius]
MREIVQKALSAMSQRKTTQSTQLVAAPVKRRRSRNQWKIGVCRQKTLCEPTRLPATSRRPEL